MPLSLGKKTVDGRLYRTVTSSSSDHTWISTGTFGAFWKRVAKHAAELLHLHRATHVYNLDIVEERQRLLADLWSGDYAAAMGQLSSTNEHFIGLLSHQSDSVNSTARFAPIVSAWPRFEGVLTALFRARSQKTVTLMSAALSVRLLHYRTPRPIWDAVHFISRIVSSPQWTEQLCADALLCAPGPPYPTAGGISAAVFDNFSMQVGYSSYATSDAAKKGYKLDMTNWASIIIPADAVPGGAFDIHAMLNSGGIFRRDNVLQEFITRFSPVAPTTIANRQRRWCEMLDRSGGVAALLPLLEKPVFNSPYPPTFLHYQSPIFDRLQSSYDDVNFEVDLMRGTAFHRYSGLIFLGGDGLTYHRLISRLRQDPRRYLMTTPVVIPQLGEHPHGTHHVLHGGWRLWWPLLAVLAQVVDNKQVVSDPEVSVFNEHEHFLRICVRACAEYVVEIASTGSDYHLPTRFLQLVDANLSFAYVCQFLYLYGFMFLQMRDAVRQNQSSILDLIWCENLATARASGTSNYSVMSVIRIYWGVALREPLNSIYHNLRTLRWIHTHVGWDMFIEVLNCIIRSSVASNVTQDFLKKFISQLNFTSVVNRALDSQLKANRERDKAKAKNIDQDVVLIKDFLRASIGSNWGQATAPSEANLLNVDMATWGGQRNPRQHTPWAQMDRAMSGDHNYRTYVVEKLTEYCHWHMWQ